jgi:hypothetical protein
MCIQQKVRVGELKTAINIITGLLCCIINEFELTFISGKLDDDNNNWTDFTYEGVSQ